MLSGVLAGALALAAVAALLASCSGSGGSGAASGSAGVSSRTDTASAAPPGKYQTLPEPCGSVDNKTLHVMLPNSRNYAGTAALAYDPDRRVGCRWTGTLQGGTRYLTVDFERIVSYDPTVSDDDKAAQQFEQMAQAAHIPGAAPNGPSGPSASAATSAPASGTATPAPTASPSASISPAPNDGATAGDTTPRRVGGIGDAAYLNDALTTVDSAIHRDVTVVFRISNVLVTVEFSQWSTDKTVVPPSVNLQLGAFGLAQQLARSFTG